MKAAVIGGGVIGGGWASRFLLNGWDVNVFDPDKDAKRKLNQMLINARRSLPSLYDFKLPNEGKVKFCSSIKEKIIAEKISIKQPTASKKMFNSKRNVYLLLIVVFTQDKSAIGI